MRMVEMLAQKELKKGVIPCPPVPSELVLRVDDAYPVEVRLVPLKVHHGATWCLKDGPVIQIKADDSPTQQRFTLFHELFHVLAHGKTTPAFRKAEARRGFFNELLAGYFAMCILMPEEWVKAKWAEVHDLHEMATIFDVPKSAMFLRLKRLGLIQ